MSPNLLGQKTAQTATRQKSYNKILGTKSGGSWFRVVERIIKKMKRRKKGTGKGGRK
jgi:hypothetical protein